MEIIIIVCALILGIIIVVIVMTSKQESVNKEIEFSNDILLELSIKPELGNRYEIIPCIIKIYKNKKRSLMKKLLQQLYCINVTKSISLPDDEIYTTTDYYYNNNMVNSNKQKTASNKNDIIYIQDSNNVVKRLIL